MHANWILVGSMPQCLILSWVASAPALKRTTAMPAAQTMWLWPINTVQYIQVLCSTSKPYCVEFHLHFQLLLRSFSQEAKHHPFARRCVWWRVRRHVKSCGHSMMTVSWSRSIERCCLVEDPTTILPLWTSTVKQPLICGHREQNQCPDGFVHGIRVADVGSSRTAIVPLEFSSLRTRETATAPTAKSLFMHCSFSGMYWSATLHHSHSQVLWLGDHLRMASESATLKISRNRHHSEYSCTWSRAFHLT